ncbi:synaptobrevin-domain-containing protein [Chytriomyces sp. MP71]|nr:synaptobrevin-domain-containing protein [Chytriomyces sp. MP71]
MKGIFFSDIIAGFFDQSVWLCVVGCKSHPSSPLKRSKHIASNQAMQCHESGFLPYWSFDIFGFNCRPIKTSSLSIVMSPPSRPATPNPQGDQSHAHKAAEIQSEVNEVIDIMQDNIEKAVKRGEKLESINNKAEHLREGATMFKKKAVKLHDDMWWKDFKTKLVLAMIGLVVIGLIGWLVYKEYAK